MSPQKELLVEIDVARHLGNLKRKRMLSFSAVEKMTWAMLMKPILS